MLEGLQDEINNWPNLVGASQKIILANLNAPGSAQVTEWVLSPSVVLKSLNEIYTYYISDETLGNLISYLQQPENAVMALRLEKATHLDFTADLVIGMLEQLLSDEVCTQSEYDALIRLGQVKKSRAQELFGRQLTIGDFE